MKVWSSGSVKSIFVVYVPSIRCCPASVDPTGNVASRSALRFFAVVVWPVAVGLRVAEAWRAHGARPDGGLQRLQFGVVLAPHQLVERQDDGLARAGLLAAAPVEGDLPLRRLVGAWRGSVPGRPGSGVSQEDRLVDLRAGRERVEGLGLAGRGQRWCRASIRWSDWPMGRP